MALSDADRRLVHLARNGKISYERAIATLDSATFERVNRVLMIGAMAFYTPRRAGKEGAAQEHA